jgi:predicted tellurium resistance membrane protein TerC
VDWLTNPEIWLAFLTLTVLEVVLGVDNVIFISILASKLPQVLLLDIVFSIDSVITAVGLTPYVPVMVAAILASVAVMLLASKGIYAFVNRHPTVKMLALSFLLLIGFTLVAEGTGVHIPKGYIYFAMGFAVFVEWLNLRAGLRGRPVKLHDPYEEAQGHPMLAQASMGAPAKEVTRAPKERGGKGIKSRLEATYGIPG